MSAVSRLVLGGAGPFDLRPLCVKGDLKAIKDYWNRFHDQIELKQGEEKSTPLHEAARRGHTSIVEYLLSKGAKVDVVTNKGMTALYLAAEGGHLECEMLLLQYRSPLIGTDGKSGLSCFETTDGLCLHILSGNEDNTLDQRCTEQHMNRCMVTAAHMDLIEFMERLLLKTVSMSGLEMAIKEAESRKNHTMTAFLKMVKAAVEGNDTLVKNLYSKKGSSISSDIRAAAAKVPTKIPLELARARSAHQVYREILIHSGLSRNAKGLEINWSGLGVYDDCIDDLYLMQAISSATVLCLPQNALTSIGEAFDALTNLVVLDLSSNALSSIHPVLFSLPRLSSLNLSKNSLTRLPNIENAQANLTHLDLSCNNFDQVPDIIEKLPQLSYLNLSYNEDIKSIPMWISSLEEMKDLRLEGLPHIEVQIKDNVTEHVMNLLRTQAENSRQFYEMKMIVTGTANAGKSSLVTQLHGGSDSTPINHAPHISISNWLYRLSPESREYEFVVWDMCRRSCYQKEVGLGIEEVFYTPFAIYLLVFDLTAVHRDASEIKLMLDAIARRSLPSCVLFVGTRLDLIAENLRPRLLRDAEETLQQIVSGYPKGLVLANDVIMHTVSLAPGAVVGVAQVQDAIFQLSSSLRSHDGQPYMGRRVLLSGVGVKGEVEEYSRLARQGDKLPVLSYKEIEKLVGNLRDNEVRSHDELESISQFLNQVGCLLRFFSKDQTSETPPQFMSSIEDSYFMDPNWLYGRVQAVLCEDLDSAGRGLFCFEEIKDKLVRWQALENNEHGLGGVLLEQGSVFVFPLVAVLVHFNLLIPLQNDMWFINPRLLRDDQQQLMANRVTKSVPFSFCQQYMFETDSEKWTKFLLSVLNTVAPLQQVNYKELQGNDCIDFICWKKGISWSKGDQAMHIEAQDDQDSTVLTVKYTPQYVSYHEELIEILDAHFPDSNTVFLCPKCFAGTSNQPQQFLIKDFIQAIISGARHLTCADDHRVELSDMVPSLNVRPTHSPEELKLELRKMRFFSSSSNHLQRYNANYHGRKVLVLKYRMSSERSLRDISTKSYSMTSYNTPCLSNEEGRLLALAIDTKHALLVCSVPPLGSFSKDSQSENPVVSSRLVINRIAVQLATSLKQLPDCLLNQVGSDSIGLQFWSLDEKSLIHCSLALSDKCLKMLSRAPPCESDNDSSGKLIDMWVYFMKSIYSLAQSCHSLDIFYLAKFLNPGASSVSLDWLTNCFSSIPVQLISDVQSLSSLQAPIFASQVPSIYSASLATAPNIVADLWLCSLYPGKDELRVSVYSVVKKAMKVFKVKSNPIEILAVEVCGDHVWLSTQLPDNVSCISIFNTSTKKLVHNVKMTGNAVTCMKRLGTEVCAGTKQGFLFIFPDDVYAIKKGDPKPRHKFVAEAPITGLASIGSWLYLAHSNSIFVFDPSEMKFLSCFSSPETVAKENPIGCLFPSQYQPFLYSVHFGSTVVRVWDIADTKHTHDIKIQESLASIGESLDTSVTAMTTAFDTIWIGLATGHILIYHETEMIVCVRPYQGPVSFLSRFVDGEHCTVISGGVRFLSPTHDQPLSENPMLVSWVAYPKNTLVQLKALQESNGRYLTSFISVAGMRQFGFEADSEQQESNNDPSSPTDVSAVVSIQLPNRQIVTIPDSSVKSIVTLMEAIQSESTASLPVVDNMSLVYHYQMYDTLVNVSTDDDLSCYLDLPDRPFLMLIDGDN